jgi:hypothetical protein
MSVKLKWLGLGGVTFLVALAVIIGAWHRAANVKVRAAAVANDTPSPTDPRSARYVGAYTVPLTAEGKATANGSGRVGEILGSSANSSAKAQALLALFPQLPATAQPAAAQHIVNLLPDNAYALFATHLTNANDSAEVRAVIYADLLQRPNAIKLPWLLAMARSPGISQAGEAAALLQATLREDHGANWKEWSERIHAWLQANPDLSEANGSH